MQPFIYDQLPVRVLFGSGMVERIGAEAERLGIARALVLTTPGQRPLGLRVAGALGARAAGCFAGAVMHVPIAAAQAARAEALRLAADGLVAAGGGSTIGLAKAIALESGLPILALPTTYSGSEMTPIVGITEEGRKRTERHVRVLPRCVIYDPVLTLGLPAAVSGPSGMNALAHCFEALYAEAANPVTSLMAEEGIRALAAALPVVIAQPDDLAARGDAFYGAWLAGLTLSAVGMALHHKLCHVLGGRFDLPHAETHAILLPHVAAYNRRAAPSAMARAARALGAADAAAGLYALVQGLGGKVALRDIGMPEGGLDEAADLACLDPYYNPRPIERGAIRRLLQDAFEGGPPADGARIGG